MILAAVAVAAAAGLARGQPAPEDVPTFAARARVTQISGRPPDPAATFALHLGTTATPAEMRGQEWCDWVAFDRRAVEENLKGYPAQYLRGWPIVTRAGIAGIVDPTQVELELRFDGGAAAIPLRGELFGPSLGILVWRDADRTPRADTMAGYNRRYWKSTEGIQLAADRRPRRFPIVDRFIGGDDDRIAWREGIEQLSRAGFTAIMLPPDARIRRLLAEAGHHRTAWAVYSPPGYAFDFYRGLTPESIAAWGRDQAKPYLEAGYEAADMALFTMSDEPGWYYPQMVESLGEDHDGLARFHAYLAGQKLTPRDLGKADWAEVMPSADRRAESLEERKLFYWTMRFLPFDSAVHFARCSKAIEEAFYPGLPVVTNWNLFSGRSYVPGDVANNQDKNDPRAGMGGHDWLEFGRLRGGSMLWTEDWFGDAQAWQWSFYCAKLRSAAAKGRVTFGSYVIPRTAGDRADGLLQKILSVIGHGGKALKYFVFGPEYNFPTNCYSERHELLPKLAEAHGMIAAAEDQLWFGTAPAARVAIVSPRSAQFWDARDADCPRMIHDATNTNLNAHTVDYMAEVFDLYLALQHANIPADFVEEDDLAGPGLEAYRVLYLTEPNVPWEHVEPLLEWVRGGGTLVTVRGAASRNRYDVACTALAEALGFRETANERVLVPNLAAAASRAVRWGDRELQARLAWSAVEPLATGTGARVVATFDDGSPAILETTLGEGRAVHFAWLPGISYWLSATGTADRLPVGFSADLRAAIVSPARDHPDVAPPVRVDVPLVETPVLASDRGMAVTLLNWTGEPISRCGLSIRCPATVSEVRSVRHGRLEFTRRDNAVEVALPLAGADIVTLR